MACLDRGQDGHPGEASLKFVLGIKFAELDDARSKFAVEAVSNEVVRDAMAFLKKKRKRKSKWGGDRKSTKFLAMEFATNDCKGARNVDRGRRDEGVYHAVDGQQCDEMRQEAYRRPEVLHGAAKTSLIGFSSILASYV
jgi:hypothetical protein